MLGGAGNQKQDAGKSSCHGTLRVAAIFHLDFGLKKKHSYIRNLYDFHVISYFFRIKHQPSSFSNQS